MADKAEFLQAIDDAITDADSLERFINGDDTQDVLTRLSKRYPTLKKALKELFENAGIAGRYKTFAELQTKGVSLEDGSYALVADDTNDKNGIYIKEGSEWVKSKYDTARGLKEFTLSSIEKLTSSSSDGLQSILTDYFASINSATLYDVRNPVTTGYSSTYLYVFATPVTKRTEYKHFALSSGTGSGKVYIKAATKLGSNLTVVKDFGSVTVSKKGINHFDISYLDVTLEPNQHLAIYTKETTNGFIDVVNPVGSDNVKWYAASASDNTVDYNDPGRHIKAWLPAFAFYEQPTHNALTYAINNTYSKTTSLLATNKITAGNQTVLSDGTGMNSGQYILADSKAIEPSFIETFSVFAKSTGVIEVSSYEKYGVDEYNNNSFKKTGSKFFSVGLGVNTINVNLPLKKGEYVGVTFNKPGLSTYTTGTKSPFYFATVGVDNPFTGITNQAYQLSATIKSLESKPKQWQGKKYTSFGDSITWYNGNNFGNTHLEVGARAKGYQSYIVDEFGCTLDNQGISSLPMPRIYEVKMANYDFRGVDYITIMSGANDARLGIEVGELLPIGSNFNVRTYIGALQTAIEKIYSQNKTVQIFLITPIRGWYNEYNTSNVPNTDPSIVGVMPRKYPDAVKQVAALYGLPVIDFYDELGWNDLNKHTYIGDNPDPYAPYLLHPNNFGYKKMGDKIVKELKGL